MHGINYNDWANLLDQAAYSRHIKQKHLYISVYGNYYYLINRTNHQTCALDEIIEKSKKALTASYHDLSIGLINQADFDQLKKRIMSSIGQLIEGRETKRNQKKFILLRLIARIISLLAGPIGYCLVNKKLDYMEKCSKQDTQKLKNQLIEHLNDLENTKLIKQKECINATIEKQIANIPNLINKLNEIYPDHEHLNLMQKLVKQIFNEQDSHSQHRRAFIADITRGISFLRKDSTFDIEDKMSYPSEELTRQEQIETSVFALRELIQNDQSWEKALQSIINQTNLNNLFDPIIGTFIANSIENQWIENENYYFLQPAFPNRYPPIQLEVIRDKKTKKITKVKVKLIGSLDIFAFNTEDKKDKKLIKSHAIQGELNYTVILDKHHCPLIRNLASKLTASLS